MSIACREAHLREVDPRSGARVFRLTSFPWVSFNIYGEVPYMDPASRYIMFPRQAAPGRPVELWRADLQSMRLEMVDDGLPGISGCAVSPDQTTFYYHRMVDENTVLVKLDIVSLGRTELHLGRLGQARSLGSVTPDKSTYVAGTTVDDDTPAIMTVDLATGETSIVYESPDIVNPHIQVDPADGNRVLVQINELDRSLPPEHPAHVRARRIGLGLLDLSSGGLDRLAIGPPTTEVNCQGHQCFIGTTGRVLATLSETGGNPSQQELVRRRQRSIDEGNLVSIGAGDRGPTVVTKGHRFTHPNASRCGRYFVSDTNESLLVVGSIATGDSRVLCDTGSSFCSAQYTHPHPYFSPDCRWVVFNSDASGVPQLHAAELPDGLLEGLT